MIEPTVTGEGEELTTPIVPVRVGDEIKAVSLWRALYERGVYSGVALYPAVARGRELLRLTVTAAHEHAHLDTALEAFEEIRERAEPGRFASA